MIKKTTLWRFLVCPILLLSVSSLNLLSAQTGPNDDFDGDGVINSIDIDDDNDGVPDAVESPSCYYTVNEWNTLAKPAVGVSIASDLTTVSGLGNFTALGDNNNTVSAVQFVTTPAQTQNNQALFTMTFTLPVQLDAFYIKKSSTTQISGGNLMFEASNDAVTWTPLFSAANNPANTATGTTANGAVALTNFNKFSVGINAGKYKYYRIRGTAANNILAGIATEFYFDFNTTAYVASMFAKATCTDANIDGDGMLPQFDLDTDGDGCNDALESGATTNTSANYQFTGNVGANGLLNSLETVADNGIVNYTSTYSIYATSSLINACIDTDGDGIRDVIDVDDDNDGVLDVVEGNVNTFLNTSCENKFIERMGYTSAFTLSNQLADKIGLIVGTNNTFTTGFPMGATCGNISFGTSDGTFNTYIYFRFVNPYNTNINVPLNYLTLTSDCAGSNEITVYDAYDINGNFLYSQSLTTTPAYGPNYCVTIQPPASVDVYSIRVNQVLSAAVLSGISLKGIPAYRDLDTDNDGIPNRLDLDSDNDGCSDLAESGVSPSTDIFTPPSANNNNGTSYGIDPTKLAGSQLNPAATDTNNDGLNDSVDPDQNGIPNYPSTYNPYAIGSNYAACADTDGDGILDINDIDDDNDGVLDAVESPACFYTATEVSVPQSVTTQIATTGTIANVYDNNIATTFTFTASSTKVNLTVFEITPPSPLKASALYIRYSTANANALGTTASSVSLEGWNGTSWTTLQTFTPAAAVANVQSFAIPGASQATYTKYRLQGLAGTVSAAVITEVGLTASSDYNPSAHPKPTCTNDPDSDGVPNHRDLDSDGDGCSDSVEAGNTVFTSNNITTYNTGTDTNTNGLLNQFESTTTPGTINYNSTYPFFAVNAARSACLDSDGDTIPDIIDIDDDNDGVLDTVEQNCPPVSSLGDPTITGVNGTVRDYNEFSYWESEQQVVIDYPYSFQNFNALFWSVDTGDNFTVSVKLDDGTIAGPLDGRMFSSTSDPSWVSRWTTKGYPVASSDVNWMRPLAELTGSPFNPGEVYYTSSYINTLQKSWGAVEFTVPQANFVNGIDQIIITIKGGVGATAFVEIEPLNIVSNCTDVDTDNDGVPNRLDLDSDGDGCPDTKEAILYNHFTEASIPGTVKNGSGGAVTSTTANVPNAMVPGPYGSNGFADALQSASNPDAYKYVYTYQFVATAADVSTCDNKFLMDIDSDDDGIPDAVESPSCFYTETQAMDITTGVTSDFTWATANPLSNTYDNNTATTNYGAVTPAVSIQNKALITFDLPVIDAALIDNVKLNVGGVAFGAGKWKLQGLDLNTNAWTDLSATAGQAMNTINTTFTFTNTLQVSTRYHSYRIIGIDNVNVTNNARLIEFTIQYKNYNPSLHRTKTGCNSDADGDGVPNYIDRDSDGDGCPDAVEAGIPLSKLGPANFFNTGGQVAGTHVIVLGNYSNNGMGDDVETTPDSGIINYTSTYTQYANNKTLNFCTDTDSDGVSDIVDIDDDNDGVLDLTECAYPATPTTVGTDVNNRFTVWSNTGNAQGTNSVPAYLTSVGSWTAGSGLTATVNAGNYIDVSNVNGNTLADAFGSNEYIEHPFTTTADNNNWLYYVRTSANNTTNYHWAMLISDDNFVTYTILNIDMLRNATGNIVYDINDYMLSPSTSYKVRTYFWGATALTFDEFTMFGYSECDTDNDGVPNRVDLDSDGEGCPDAVEAGTAAQAGAGNTSSGTLVNTSGTQTGVANAIVGNNTPAAYGANGFYNGIENNDTAAATYLGTYTYASALNASISVCFCYKPAITSGTVLDTKQGITSLKRAGSDNDNWPMVRKGAWTALESKTKGFVPNRLTITQINAIPAANLREGMMVYNISSDCLYINTDGTATGWKCFNTQTCP
ncbi:hypothetical protein D3C71_211760 [compost metagenome]